MTVKDQLHARIERMTESEAAELLSIVDLRATDPLTRLWDDAPLDDESWMDSDQAALDQDRQAGDTILSVDEFRRELAR